MFIELGHFALAVSLGIAVVQCVVPLLGASTKNTQLMRVAAPASLLVFMCVAMAYAALTFAYIESDFSVINVVQNSHSAKPLIYKISGVWSNHEGSILLWVFVLALCGAILALATRSTPARLRYLALACQGAVTSAFLVFVLFFSNPFLRIIPPLAEGYDLNPLLQDPGLAIHPPLLYLGYVGFSISFAFACAALIDGKIDAVWARAVRPWTLGAWIFLTLGIAMGSYWAYYELGWGGWWFWDPVENSSLMPWLIGTALVHSTVVMERRDALKVWTILLAILTFSLSLLGTFLVRSGILTSVHSFAVDSQRGIAILYILLLFIGGSLTLFAWRAPMLRQGGLFAPVSREGGLVLNNLLLSTACATVFVGTFYPLIIEFFSADKISVGAPFFNTTFIPLALPLFIILPIGQVLAWKRGNARAVIQRLLPVMALSFLAATVFWLQNPESSFLALASAGIGVYVVLGSFHEIIARSWKKGSTVTSTLKKAVALPRSTWGAVIAHAGVGLSIIGVAATGWGAEELAMMKPGDSLQAGSYSARLERILDRKVSNYIERVAVITIFEGAVANNKVVGTVEPAKRLFSSRGMPTTEAGIKTIGFGQVYASVGEFNEDGTVGVHLFLKPLVLLIWIGSVIMALGGAIALSDWRFRISLPARAKQKNPARNQTGRKDQRERNQGV